MSVYATLLHGWFICGYAVFGTVLFGRNRPGLLYLFAFTIPLAPTFNMLGIPNGIGALWFAGHPLKGFNLISLFVVAVATAIIISRRRR